MASAVYFLCFVAALLVFFRYGRKLAGPRWNSHRGLAGTIVALSAFAGALFWPFTGILALLVWVIGLAFNPPAGQKPTDRDKIRRVLPGLATSTAFIIGLIAFAGLSAEVPTESVRPHVSTQVVESTAPAPNQAPRATVTPAPPAEPTSLVPAPATAVVPPRPPVPAPPAATQRQAPRVVIPAPADPPQETVSCDADHYRNSDGNCVHRPEQAPAQPAGATAQCEDGTYSFSQHRQGTCSRHGGVARWF